jgi:hypothetical protein
LDSNRTLISAAHLRELVDRLILETGRLDPVALLVAAGLVAHEDEASWRAGHRTDLQGVIKGAPDGVSDLLEQAARYAIRQGLVATRTTWPAFGGAPATPRVGADPRLSAACALVYVPSPDRCQLDLFQESPRTLIEAAIREALISGRAEEARAEIGRLTAHGPSPRRVQGFLQLTAALEDAPPLRHGRSGAARARELDEIASVAEEFLGARARDFMRALWVSLAEALAGQTFSPRDPEAHAAFAWIRAGRWASARGAIEADPEWRTHPALVCLHAEACWSLEDWTDARRDWLSLCHTDPEEAERIFAAPAFADRHLAGLWDEFGDLPGDLQTEDFPVWLMIRDPHACGVLPDEALPDDDRADAYRLLRRMARGEDGIESRQRLGELNPTLLRLYLSQERS